jgi:hypothetical protein
MVKLTRAAALTLSTLMLAAGSAQAGGCNYGACQVKVAKFSPYAYNAGLGDGTGWVIGQEARSYYSGIGSRLLGHVKTYDYSGWFVFGAQDLVPADVLGPQPWPVPSWARPYLIGPFTGPTFSGAYPCPYADGDPTVGVALVPACA